MAAPVLALGVGACGGTQVARARNAEPLPPDGSMAEFAADELSVQTIPRSEWEAASKEKIALACDARGTPAKPAAATLDRAKTIIDAWTELKEKQRKEAAAKGAELGNSSEPTAYVDSFAITCGPDKSALTVNRREHPFEMAWVLVGAVTSSDGDAGRFVVVEALSVKRKRVVFAKVFVPNDATKATDDNVIIANIGAFLPSNPDEPIVHNVGEPEQPKLEMFVSAAGMAEGFYYYAPKRVDLSRARWLGVGRFLVGAD